MTTTTQSPATKLPAALGPTSFAHDSAFVAKLAMRADYIADFARALQKATPGTHRWNAAAIALVERCATWSGPWPKQGTALPLRIRPYDAARVLGWLDCPEGDPDHTTYIKLARRLRDDLDRGAAVIDDQAEVRREWAPLSPTWKRTEWGQCSYPPTCHEPDHIDLHSRPMLSEAWTARPAPPPVNPPHTLPPTPID
jgi:hypothetical protein